MAALPFRGGFASAPATKRPRGNHSREPELLVITLDPRLCTLEAAGAEGKALFPELWESILLFLRAFMLLTAGQKVVILGATAPVMPLCEICDVYAWEAAQEGARRAAVKLEPRAACLAAVLSSSLCLVHQAQRQQKLQARVLVIDASASEVDYIEESSGLVNVAFAAKSQGILVDSFSLGSCPSSLLRQVCKLAEGKHVRLSSTEKFGEMAAPEVLAASMLFHFLASQAGRSEFGSSISAWFESIIYAWLISPLMLIQ